MDTVQRAKMYTYAGTVLPATALDVRRVDPLVKGFTAGAESLCGRCWTGLLMVALHVPLEPPGLLMYNGMGVMLKYIWSKERQRGRRTNNAPWMCAHRSVDPRHFVVGVLGSNYQCRGRGPSKAKSKSLHRSLLRKRSQEQHSLNASPCSLARLPEIRPWSRSRSSNSGSMTRGRWTEI